MILLSVILMNSKYYAVISMKLSCREKLVKTNGIRRSRIPCGNLGGIILRLYTERRVEREETVLLTLARAKSALSSSEIMERVDDEHDNFPLKNVTNFLYRLENKGLIREIHRKGFCVIDPMFREYILLKSDIR